MIISGFQDAEQLGVVIAFLPGSTLLTYDLSQGRWEMTASGHKRMSLEEDRPSIRLVSHLIQGQSLMISEKIEMLRAKYRQNF
jgi:hypothetical protein